MSSWLVTVGKFCERRCTWQYWTSDAAPNAVPEVRPASASAPGADDGEPLMVLSEEGVAMQGVRQGTAVRGVYIATEDYDAKEFKATGGEETGYLMVRKGQRIEVLSEPGAPSPHNKHQGPCVYCALCGAGWLPFRNLKRIDGLLDGAGACK